MINFRLNLFLDTAKELLRADETERALWLLDNLPAYYREHVPKAVVELKNEILKKISTTQKYINGVYELEVMDLVNGNGMDETLRGKMIIKDVEFLNNLGHTPHIIDYGPGEYWLPIVLHKHGLKFTYQDIYLNKFARNKALPLLDPYLIEPNKNEPSIFVAYEIIEHLWQEHEIKTQLLYNHGPADILHISTPAYTYDTDCTDWNQKDELGHLRAYTPQEFSEILTKLFPEYTTFLYVSRIMQMRLTHKESKFQEIKDRAYVEFENL